MSIDSFTSVIMLAAVKNNSANEEILKLYKELKENNNPPHPDIVKLVTSWIGKKCKVKFTDYIGIVHGVNTSNHGFYPGGRFPVYVKITKSDMPSVIGSVFEYELDQIELDD